ncbi:MAG: CvpA family protein [Cytophagaceae bacterium]
MKVLDILLLVLLLIGAWNGYKKGLLVQILSFLALIVAIISAFKLLHWGIEYLSPHFEGSNIVPFITFTLLFFLVFFLIYLLSRALKKVINYTLLGTFDNYAGALLGVCEAAFGLSLLLWLFRNSGTGIPASYTTGTFLYPELLNFAPNVVSWASYIIPFQDIFPSIKKTLRS